MYMQLINEQQSCQKLRFSSNAIKKVIFSLFQEMQWQRAGWKSSSKLRQASFQDNELNWGGYSYEAHELGVWQILISTSHTWHDLNIISVSLTGLSLNFLSHGVGCRFNKVIRVMNSTQRLVYKNAG